jgi:hypothetical protein
LAGSRPPSLRSQSRDVEAFTDGSRAYFTGMAKIQAAKGETEVANAMNAFLRDPADAPPPAT